MDSPRGHNMCIIYLIYNLSMYKYIIMTNVKDKYLEKLNEINNGAEEIKRNYEKKVQFNELVEKIGLSITNDKDKDKKEKDKVNRCEENINLLRAAIHFADDNQMSEIAKLLGPVNKLTLDKIITVLKLDK